MRTLRKLARHPSGLTGGSIILLLILVALLAPLIAPYEPTQAFAGPRLRPPNPEHVLGTDQLGRDILSRIIWGARLSIINGLGAVALGGSVGVLMGLASGYLGRRTDMLLMRAVDVLLAFPTLLMALLIVATLGPGFTQTLVAIGLALVAPFARLTRGEVVRVREWTFVEGALAIGAKGWRVASLHILPNVLSPILIYATLRFGTAILTEASLSFLGLGPSPPSPAWGLMVNEGLRFIRVAWWIPIMPGIAVFLMVLGANLLGDALRDVLDPRMRLRGVRG